MNKKDIKEIIFNAKNKETYEERLDFLKNRFGGQTCYILACGPSMRDIDKEKLIDEVRNNCLFTIKQSFFSFRDHVDFHFFNTNNFINYPDSRDIFYVGSSDWGTEESVRTIYWKEQQVDICTRVHGKVPLGVQQHHDGFKGLTPYTFENSGLLRHWGAGIMFENVLYFALHLGFQNIRTVGWDYVNVSAGEKNHIHFYDEASRFKLVNPAAKPYDTEFSDSIEMSRLFHEYFSKMGINIRCHQSDKCFLPEEIERYKL